ncbi:MAG: bifunctional methylenetetrahydrofolate dehydrogenase/methenyltetrahydrofolate cyclohydrolase FolD [Chloroflexi bacterium]|nr:bifunctional methylenetetrahydrofolate dehydrogenase/methenyltetrahydrofolate cyclohydrolase FolD [Chloroflexota bacterium]
MRARVINGTRIAEEIRAEVAAAVHEMKAERGVAPGLAAVLVGDNPASVIYVRNKGRACQEAGIFAETFHLPGQTPQGELLALLGRLNADPRFHGILLQLPLPAHLDERAALLAIDPAKDIDGLHPVNMGRLVEGEPRFVPCTPAGIQQLLMRSGYDPSGRHVVVCGRSNIVGKPAALLLMQKRPGANATVTVCHTGTRDLGAITRQADILIVAAGRPNTVTADMVRDGVVVVDVGMNRVADPSRERGYRLVGDVDFPGVAEKAEAITPVPGGVGPMTVAMLVHNTFQAAKAAVHGQG